MPSMDKFADISYASSGDSGPFHKFDLYVPQPLSNDSCKSIHPLLCFVHGGAWRSEDKSEHDNLARNLSTRLQLPVAVPNYRLTPKNPTGDDFLQHPAHAEDILKFLEFLLVWEGPPSLGATPPYDRSKILLLGHSCSAHMLASIFLDSSAVTPSLKPSAALRGAVRGITLSEGIYNLDLLLSSFPAYRGWFIENAFGKREDFSQFNVATYPLRSGAARFPWLVLHSKGDTLVDSAQSETMYEHLFSIHNDRRLVTKNFDQINEDHNDLLQGSTYQRIVADWIRNLQL